MELLKNTKLPDLLLAFLAALLSLAWLIPNHYPPWTSFHSDALMGFVFIAIGFIVVLSYKGVVSHRLMACVGLALGVLVVLQQLAGVIYFSGEAFISFLYCVGFALAVLIGQYWSGARPDAPENFLFFAVGVAALGSVGIQLCQLFGTNVLDLWLLQVPTRPSGNLSQTNQMATLLIWGLVTIAWGYERQHIGKVGAGLAALYLLAGVAMTQSRTGALELLTVAALYMAGPFRAIRSQRIATSVALILYFAVLSILMPHLMVLLEIPLDYTVRTAGLQEARIEIWSGLGSVAFDRPWFGYGMKNITEATFQAASTRPGYVWLVGQSHNLFLDFVLWFGFPVGLAVSGLILYWIFAQLRSSSTPKQYVQCMVIFAVGIHAMLELPLHYAYFLLPAGLIAGSLEQTRALPSMQLARRPYLLSALGLVAVMLSVVAIDYLRFENTYRVFRHQNTPEGKNIKYEPPETMVLNQWRDMIYYIRRDPNLPLAEGELEQMRQITFIAPAQLLFIKYAIGLTRAGQFEEASRQLKISCRIGSEKDCKNLIVGWNTIAKDVPNFKKVATTW